MALALPQRYPTDSLPSQLLGECDQSSAPCGSRRRESFAMEMNTNSKMLRRDEHTVVREGRRDRVVIAHRRRPLKILPVV